MAEQTLVVRPALVGRLLAVIYPDGIPADQVAKVAEVSMYLDIALGVARGTPRAVPLAAYFPDAQPAAFDLPEVRCDQRPPVVRRKTPKTTAPEEGAES